MKPSFDANLRLCVLVPNESEEAKDLPLYLSIQLESPNTPFTLDFRTADTIFVGQLIDDLLQVHARMLQSDTNAPYAETEDVVTDPDLAVKLTQFGLVPVPPPGGNNPPKE